MMPPSTINPASDLAAQPRHYLHWSAKGKSGVLRYFIGSLLVLSISLYFGQVFSAIGGSLIASQSPAATIIKTTFFGFIVSFFLVPMVARLLHRRPWWSIAMPVKRFDGVRFGMGILVMVVAMVVLNLGAYFLNPEAYHYQGADWSSWIPMLFISFLIFFVQTGTEEMVYRGYLMQFVHRFTKHPLAILLIPSIIFASPHAGNIAGLSGFGAIAPYILYGMLYGWLAYRSGSLWMPVGAHLANNWFITMFLGSSQEKIQKVSLVMTTGGSVEPVRLVLTTALFVLLVAVLAELILRRTGKLVVP